MDRKKKPQHAFIRNPHVFFKVWMKKVDKETKVTYKQDKLETNY